MSAISEVLHIDDEIRFFNDITKFEYHTHTTYSGQKLGLSDEVRITIQNQDIFTLPCKSFLILEGTVKCTKPGAASAAVKANYTLIPGSLAFLFEELRFEVGGNEVAKSRLVGISSAIKSILLKSVFNKQTYDLAGFSSGGYTLDNDTFSFIIPLKILLPFFEDFQRIVLNLKQELVLLRSSTDINCIQSADGTSVSIDLTKIQWKVPYLQLDDAIRLRFLKMLDSDRPLKLAFRRWQIHEFPNLTESRTNSWAIRTAAAHDVPKYMILGFQTNRKNNFTKSAYEFDLCDIYNVKLYLNSVYFPYDNILGNKRILYKMFLDFAPSYYNTPINTEYGHEIDFKNFCEKTPLIVIDCSLQLEQLKASCDIRLDLEFSKDVPKGTSAYCILISDSIVEYKPLTSIVREVQ